MKKTMFAVGLLCAAMLAQTGASTRVAFTRKLVDAAIARSKVKVRYVSDYVGIAYPGGDVPADTGVCTDEIIRIYRQVGIDLQKEVHEDMLRRFSDYPSKHRRPDRNIDHRRVPILMTFFHYNGEELAITRNPDDYRPGDIVAWNLHGGVTHIGMVVDQENLLRSRYKILHNIGEGPQIEDVLFDWKIIGHYRYYGPLAEASSLP